MKEKINLQIAYIDYSITTRSLDIFTIGCNPPHCKGCHNNEIWDWNQDGLSLTESYLKIKQYISDFDILIDRIFILGGEPVHAELKTNNEVSYLIRKIKKEIDKPIFLFTRHQLDDIPESLKDCVDYIKTGPYIPELTTDNNIQFGIKLATSNQKIYKKYNKEWRLENELDN